MIAVIISSSIGGWIMIGPVEMGALLKKIRLSKNLTLKELASDYLSVSFLSKFERGESDISLSRFFLLLDKLDVSIEEFYGILSQDNPTHTEKLLESASKAYYQNDILLLQKYAREERHKFEVTQDKSFLYNSIMLESFLASVSNKEVDENKVRELTDYLFSIEQWGKRELIILGNSMSFISTQTLNILTKEIVYRTRLFGNSDSNQRIRLSLLINAASEFLRRDELDLINDSGIPEVLLYERHELIFVMGTYLIKSGEVTEGRNLIEGCLETLRTLGAENLLLTKESEYQELLNSTI